MAPIEEKRTEKQQRNIFSSSQQPAIAKQNARHPLIQRL
jgi:hypothetical protein